jgi:hypothetical protein
MEDIALSKALKKLGQPAIIRTPATTSARRWQENGILRSVLCMWWLRGLYWLGMDPQRLQRWYRQVR